MRQPAKSTHLRRLTGMVAVAGMLLSACGSGDTSPVAPDIFAGGARGPVEVYPGAQQAFFAQFPGALLTAAILSCTNPGQSVRQPDGESVVCESLPSPEGAAALILAHNGTVENLPRLYTTFVSQPSGAGFLVSGDSYVAVPQRDGGTVQLRLPEADAEMRDLLEGAGGQPVQAG